ncbi:ureidoglycolate lyase [Devosia rhodophyticola]|uniref:Ureidoglycolate lyase n=1 Tax=Devosia rhodophyticola TaxID=3026423 RepID=A0ABY7YXU9_9HYPH|nr:ureidoglycolate lyase [Devosia rhodophyticola]WDR06215.1 ureidoglycolate lyase [Devosia rhodophyticola]
MHIEPINQEGLGDLALLLGAPEGQYRDVPEVYDHDGTPGQFGMAILCPPQVEDGPVPISAVERHPHSAQTFFALNATRWLVCVMPSLPDGSPDIAKARCFMAGVGDAVCIAANVWHAGLTALDANARMAMMMWRTDSGEDGVLFQLETPLTYSL